MVIKGIVLNLFLPFDFLSVQGMTEGHFYITHTMSTSQLIRLIVEYGKYKKNIL